MISVHWIPTHRGAEDKERFARWQPPFVKIVSVDEKPPYTEDVPAGAKIVIRNHPMSELYGSRGLAAVNIAADGPTLGYQDQYESYFAAVPDSRYADQISRRERPRMPVREAGLLPGPEATGAEHATACNRMADYLASKGVARTRLLFEGLNEPQLWANEPPALVARYYSAFLDSLHGYALRGVVGHFGVGWPGNGGVADSPPQWDFFKPVIQAMQPGDYLGLHEYWALNSPAQNWRWWAGRFLQCPFDVPILITECGIDTGVTGNFYGGWYDLPGSSTDEKAVRYVDDLWWYAEQCAADGRVKGIFPFTYDIGGNEWEKFDIRSEPFMAEFFEKLDAEGMPQPGNVTPPPPVDPPTPPPPVVSAYKIVAVVMDDQPNEAPYLLGKNFMVDEAGAYVKPMQKRVQVAWEGETNPANWIEPVVDAEGNWAFTPAQNDLVWNVRAVDEVRGIDSGWHRMDLNRRQMKMTFRWTPTTIVPPPPPPPTTGEQIRNRAWNELGIAHNPDAAFSKFARAAILGNPVTEEFDVDGYRAQGFAGGIVYCLIGDWGNVKVMDW